MVTSLEGDNIVVFHYLSAAEIWPDIERWPLVGRDLIRGVDFGREGPNKRGGLW